MEKLENGNNIKTAYLFGRHDVKHHLKCPDYMNFVATPNDGKW